MKHAERGGFSSPSFSSANHLDELYRQQACRAYISMVY